MDKTQIVGVTIGYSGKPQLCFADRKILFSSDADYLLYPEYFPDGKGTWPIDPDTKEKLPVFDFNT